MEELISLHDHYITGLIYDRKHQNLFIQVEESSGNQVLLQYLEIAGWDLSPFDEQNILFDVHEYDQNNLPEWIIKDFEVPQNYVDLIKTGHKKLFYLEPSIGCGGYIVAAAQIYKKQSLLKV